MSSSSPTSAPLLGCIETCQRCLSILDIDKVSGSPLLLKKVGPQLRHVIDHFRSFLRGYRSGTIDYDRRDRDRDLETNPQKCRQAFAAIVDQLSRIPDACYGDLVDVRQMAAPQCTDAVRSSVGRELIFVSSHTIHHVSIIVQMLKASGIDPSSDLELAFSTAAFMHPLVTSQGLG